MIAFESLRTATRLISLLEFSDQLASAGPSSENELFVLPLPRNQPESLASRPIAESTWQDVPLVDILSAARQVLSEVGKAELGPSREAQALLALAQSCSSSAERLLALVDQLGPFSGQTTWDQVKSKFAHLLEHDEVVSARQALSGTVGKLIEWLRGVMG